MDEIIAKMVAYKGDLRAYARGFHVDQEEVESALEEVEPDTAEYICLQILKKWPQYKTRMICLGS
jgi:hypothetical protein